METVQFVTCEDEGTDQVVGFALAYDETDIRSLILMRTPKYESFLDDSERGVSVSLEFVTDDDNELLVAVRFESNRVTIETRASKYVLDVSRLDPEELSEMKALIGRMNFDDRFRIEDA